MRTNTNAPEYVLNCEQWDDEKIVSDEELREGLSRMSPVTDEEVREYMDELFKTSPEDNGPLIPLQSSSGEFSHCFGWRLRLAPRSTGCTAY